MNSGCSNLQVKLPHTVHRGALSGAWCTVQRECTLCYAQCAQCWAVHRPQRHSVYMECTLVTLLYRWKWCFNDFLPLSLSLHLQLGAASAPLAVSCTKFYVRQLLLVN